MERLLRFLRFLCGCEPLVDRGPDTREGRVYWAGWDAGVRNAAALIERMAAPCGRGSEIGDVLLAAAEQVRLTGGTDWRDQQRQQTLSLEGPQFLAKQGTSGPEWEKETNV